MQKIFLGLIVLMAVFANSFSAVAADDNKEFYKEETWQDFIKDSKLNLNLRNMYFDRDNRENGKYSGSAQEWGQSWMLDYRSGYTPGQIKFGVDAMMRGLLRMSGDGKKGAEDERRNPGQLFPVNKYSGRAVHGYNSFNFAGKVKLSESELKVGQGLRFRNPVISSNDSRLIPQIFSGYAVTSEEVDDLKLSAGQINRVKGRVSERWNRLSISGADSGSSDFYFAGADYAMAEDIDVQYYFANLRDFYNQHFVGIKHNTAVGYGKLKTDLRYFYSTSDGKNAGNSRYENGYLSRGYYGNGITAGEVDNQIMSAKFNYEIKGHSLGAGYQYSAGESDFPYINNSSAYSGDSGSTVYLITNLYNHKFTRAGEKTWVVDYSYDFAKIGVDGLSSGLVYANGRGIKTAKGQSEEWERDFYISYSVQQGMFKGLSFLYKNSMFRGKCQDNVDENYFVVNYGIELY